MAALYGHAQEVSTGPQAAALAAVSDSAGPMAGGPLGEGAGIISGTLLDANGDVVQGAEVDLDLESSASVQTVQSGSDGQFMFDHVAAGAYRLHVKEAGMTPYTSGEIGLKSGENLIVPAIKLAVTGGVTSVTVSGNPQVLSEEQFRIAVQQRIGGIIPNFYSAYDWNAPPMLAKQKFQLSLRAILDPVSFLMVAGVAGAEQYQNVFPEYGGGWEGYGKRYGAAMANHVTGNLLGRAVYPVLFHEDPRYFYKGKGSIMSRSLYAMSAAVVARGDNGRWKPNYANVLGNFSAGAISNAYYPPSDRGVTLTLLNGLAETGADAASNLIREFVLKGITSHVPSGANGQH
ncbi:MAG: carboxypeptidase-like regulatory domain-containing protein [Terracidiphilus sp.]